MQKLSKRSGQRGFTLIELMIVVAIIGILAAVAVPKFAEMIRKSKEGATKGSLSAIKSALTIYASDNEGVTPISRTNVGTMDLNVAAAQTAALGYMNVAFIPKYLDSWPVAKLGTYHDDRPVQGSEPVKVAREVSTLVNPGQLNISLAQEWLASVDVGDIGGWVYLSTHDGVFWVNCRHTDTKNAFITMW